MSPHHPSEHGKDAVHGNGGGHGGGNGGRHGHGHGRGAHGHSSHDTDIDWERMAPQLESGAELQLPGLRDTAARLRGLLGPGREVRRVLDIGSGPGVMTCVLAEAFPEAEAVAVDGSTGLLDLTRKRAERLGLAGRVSVRHAELPDGLDQGLGTADLIWTSRTVHHLGDQQRALESLAAVLRPGGLLALCEGGLPMRFLPRDIGIGRPGLQARLDAAGDESFEAMRADLPGSTRVVEDWPALLTRAGLVPSDAFSFLVDHPAPLHEPARGYLHGYLARVRDMADELLDAEDRKTLDLLLDAEAPEGVLRRPDVFLLTASTVFTAVRPA
ncbi:trans-aconitate 2-methyltransferase [Streptomyces sp. GC420]|uniref:class I SAM-dependent methyltransferase n=1 Tax=Streptomyces sp. GC420 TaxID=2697568 RepID=UPI0014152E0C|nr:class I SAM-dependent methyltransferase [Streptomyces sp. GC420]NBM15717.1 methyltransferase domain-containing protein [Streptomyces sp. GC420]